MLTQCAKATPQPSHAPGSGPEQAGVIPLLPSHSLRQLLFLSAPLLVANRHFRTLMVDSLEQSSTVWGVPGPGVQSGYVPFGGHPDLVKIHR